MLYVFNYSHNTYDMHHTVYSNVRELAGLVAGDRYELDDGVGREENCRVIENGLNTCRVDELVSFDGGSGWRSG